jgi:hypothetical protein
MDLEANVNSATVIKDQRRSSCVMILLSDRSISSPHRYDLTPLRLLVPCPRGNSRGERKSQFPLRVGNFPLLITSCVRGLYAELDCVRIGWSRSGASACIDTPCVRQDARASRFRRRMRPGASPPRCGRFTGGLASPISCEGDACYGAALSTRTCEHLLLPTPGSLLERQLLRREKVAVFATTDKRSELDQRQPHGSDVLCTFNVDANK